MIYKPRVEQMSLSITRDSVCETVDSQWLNQLVYLFANILRGRVSECKAWN